MDDWTVAGPLVQGSQTVGATDSSATPDAVGANDYDGEEAPFASDSRVLTWLRLIRPSALLLVIVPALTALELLWLRGAKLLAVPALAGILSLVLVQAGASLLDVYLEYARRAHLPEPKRRDQLTARALLARSQVQPMNVLRMSILLLILGAVAGVPLVVTGGWLVVLLGVVGLATAFLFSATTFALKRFSLSDFIIALALGPGIVAVMILAQRHSPRTSDMLFAGALGLLAMLPALGAHLRDAQNDALLGRATLVTTLGDGIGRAIYVFCLLAALALLALAALPAGAPHGALLAFFALPAFSIPVSGALRAGPGYAREQVVLQELRAYAIFAFWLLVGLAVNAVLISGLGPIPATV